MRILIVKYFNRTGDPIKEILGVFDNDALLEHQRRLAEKGLEEEEAFNIKFEVLEKEVNELTYT